MSDARLQRYLRERPLAFALWRYSELVALDGLDWPGAVLDLGCGDGLFGEMLFANCDVVGLDGDAKALHEARRRGVYRELVHGDIHTLPFPDASFDHVFANCVVEHLEDPSRAFREVRRVLRPGGRLVFTVPSEEFAASLFGARLLRAAGASALAERYGDAANRMLDHRHLLPAEQWRDGLLDAGFAEVQTTHYAGAAVGAAFDLLAVAELHALFLRRVAGRWWVLPKGPWAARLVRRLTGEPRPVHGAGLLVEASRDP